ASIIPSCFIGSLSRPRMQGNRLPALLLGWLLRCTRPLRHFEIAAFFSQLHQNRPVALQYAAGKFPTENQSPAGFTSSRALSAQPIAGCGPARPPPPPLETKGPAAVSATAAGSNNGVHMPDEETPDATIARKGPRQRQA